MTKTNDFRVVVMMAALALAVSAAALVLVGPPASAANTLVVDDDKVECGKATFTSIQDAADAAGQGDLIRVCPGQYHESVIVDKPLTLAAEDRDALDALDCFDPAVATLDPTRHTIVDPAGSGFSVAFKLEANKIDLSGFVVQGASVGIDSSDSFSGYRVHHNLIRQNTLFGMDFGSKGDTQYPQSRVDHNCFRDPAPPTAPGTSGTRSWGLVSELDDDSLWKFSDGPERDEWNARDLINASIDHNSTFRNQVGLDIAGPGRHYQVTFANNVSREDNVIGIAIQNSKESRIVDNELSPIGRGIWVGGANDGLEITGNEATTGTIGIAFAPPNDAIDQFTEPTTNATVSGNTLTGQTGTGIFASAARPGFWPGRLQESEILNNTTSDNAGSGIGLASGNNNNKLLGNTANGNTLDGIQLLVGSINNEVRGNTANNNGRSGIHATLGATGNTFKENSMHENGGNPNPATLPHADARDDNPLLDGALQNEWINNDCDTDFPLGRICGV